MCHAVIMEYTCGCSKQMKFIQCEERAGTNAKCHSVEKRRNDKLDHYCSTHLVRESAKKTFDNLRRNVN